MRIENIAVILIMGMDTMVLSRLSTNTRVVIVIVTSSW